MPFDITLFLLRLGLVGLLYVFLLQVVLLVRRDLGRTATSSPDALADRLVVLEAGQSGLNPGDILTLGRSNTIGRGPANDVLLPDDSVSTRHAQLTLRGRQWWLEDLGSTNGTRVNGRLLEHAAVVTDGDLLEFGRVRLQLERPQ